jgi:hypothetical protein
MTESILIFSIIALTGLTGISIGAVLSVLVLRGRSV